MRMLKDVPIDTLAGPAWLKAQLNEFYLAYFPNTNSQLPATSWILPPANPAP